MSKKHYSVQVSKEITFSEQDHKELLALLLKRFNNSERETHKVWVRILQSNPSFEQFQQMLRDLGIRGT